MTQTQEGKGFAPAPEAIQPITSNLGYIIDVGDTYKSENSPYGYYVTPLTIHGLGGGKEHRVWWVFQPEWLSTDFDPNELSGQQGKPDEVYRNNIADSESLSILQAVSGPKYNELCAQLMDIDQSLEYENYCTQVSGVLSDFFNNNQIIFGYVLTQQKEKVGDEWKLSKYMKVQRYFEASEENLEKERFKAQKSSDKYEKVSIKNRELIKEGNGKNCDKLPTLFKVTFDDGTPF